MRYIAAADAQYLRHLPLAARLQPADTEAEHDNLLFLVAEALLHRPTNLLQPLPGCDRLQKIRLLPHHIHQRQRRSIGAGFYHIRQGHILAGLALGTKMHQDLIFHTPGGVGSQPCPFGNIKGGDPLDQSDGANGYQILLLRRVGVVFLVGVRLAEIF